MKKFFVLFLLLCQQGCCFVNSSNELDANELSENDIVKIAKDYAQKNGRNVNDYVIDLPVRYSDREVAYTDKGEYIKGWCVFFIRKKATPGGHFVVIVSNKRACALVPGA